MGEEIILTIQLNILGQTFLAMGARVIIDRGDLSGMVHVYSADLDGGDLYGHAILNNVAWNKFISNQLPTFAEVTAITRTTATISYKA